VKFKNDLERRVFETACLVFGDAVSIEHNKTIQIEVVTSAEVASFVGPPRKEIDVITANIADVKLLISCKDFGNSKAEPAHVQEWVAVVNTMNRYSAGTRYLGLVISPSGFTSGCEPWASTHNLGLIPPLKGKKLSFSVNTSLQMVERVLRAFSKRLNFPYESLKQPPTFYDFVYKLTEPFEGRDQNAIENGDRYKLIETGWISSFGELVRMLQGETLESITATATGIYVGFSNSLAFHMLGAQIIFGRTGQALPSDEIVDLSCQKNFSGEQCSMSFLLSMVIGKQVTSAGDWGSRFELGLSEDLMLAIEPNRLQVYRTRNPVDDNLL
jgi:hypothetical protein